MAVMEGGESTVIPNREGGRTTPSVVAFTKSGERLVGQAAKRQAITNPANTIFSAKRLIGRKYSEVKDVAATLPYKVVEGANGAAMIECQVGDKTQRFSPAEISAMVLQQLKADAEAYLGEKITEAVITATKSTIQSAYRIFLFTSDLFFFAFSDIKSVPPFICLDKFVFYIGYSLIIAILLPPIHRL